MTASALFSGSTQPTPADINSRFSGLVSKGVYSGGLVTATGTNNNVTVAPYVAMTSFGMMVFDDTASTVGLSPAPIGSNQYVYIHAIYNAFGPATVALLRTTTPQVDTATESYICVCVVKPYVTGFVVNDLITYDLVSGTGRDQVTPVRDSKYLGYFQTLSERNAKYPNHVAGTVSVPRIGDTTSFGTTSTNYVVSFWDGLTWQDLENTAALKALFAAHVADAVAHTTADQHAALMGTQGTPSAGNRFVTETDPGILPPDLYKSLQYAIGESTLSQSNPVVSKSLVIAVPRVFQVAVASTSSKILLTAAALGRTDLIAYIGKQGNNGQSSAVQYFAIEDDYGNGYISTVSGLPVYVTDVLDSTGTVQINPGDDANVDTQGFYDAEAYNGIVLQLSSPVAIGTRLYVRMNIKGDVSALTPNWPGSGGSSFLPAITAFRNGKNSYVSALLGDFNTLVIGTSTAGTIPNTQLTTRLADVNVAPKVIQTFREGSTPRASISVQTSTTSPSNIAGTMDIWSPSFRIRYIDAPDSPCVLIDSSGIQSYMGVYVAGPDAIRLGGIDENGRVFAAQGNAALPGFYFAGELDADDTSASTATGIYYRPDYTTSQSPSYSFDLHNGVGISILGKTALFIARTTDTTPLTDMDCPLMILQDYHAVGNTVNYYIGMDNNSGLGADPVPGKIAFGAWAAATPYAVALELNIKDSIVETPFTIKATARQILGKNTAIASDELAPAFSFVNATSTGMFYVDTWSNVTGTVTYNNGIGFSVNAHAAFIITQDIDSASQPITGFVTNPLILNQKNDGTQMSYDFAISDYSLDGLASGAIRFGSVMYTGVYRPMLSVNAIDTSVDVLVRANFSDRLIVNGNNAITGTQVYFTDCGQGLISTGTSILVGNQGGAYVEVLNSDNAMRLVGAVTVRGTSVAGIINVVGSSGNPNATGTFQTMSSGVLLGYGTTPSNTQKIFWGANNPTVNAPIAYLSTSGRVYAAPVAGGITYGFAGVDAIGVGVDGSNLRLFGQAILVDDMAVSNTLLSSHISTNTLIVDSSIQASTVTSSGNIVAQGLFVGPTITALEAAISAAAPTVAKLNAAQYDLSLRYYITSPSIAHPVFGGTLNGPAANINETTIASTALAIAEGNLVGCNGFFDTSLYKTHAVVAGYTPRQRLFANSASLTAATNDQFKFVLDWSRSVTKIYLEPEPGGVLTGPATGAISLVLPETEDLLPVADELVVRFIRRNPTADINSGFMISVHRPYTAGQFAFCISASQANIGNYGTLVVRARRSAGAYDWKIDTWLEYFEVSY